MKIYIKSISLNNFFNFTNSKFELKFSPDTSMYNIISGSNGSGKSVLAIESIYQNLFGKSIRCNKIEEIIRIGEESTSVSIVYSIFNNSNNYLDVEITRQLLQNKSQKITINILNDDYPNDNIKEKIVEISNISKINIVNEELQSFMKTTSKEFIKTFVHYPFSKEVLNIENAIKDPRIFEGIETLFEIGNIAKKKMDELSIHKTSIFNQIENIQNIFEKINNVKIDNIDVVKEELENINKNIFSIKHLLNKNKECLNKLNNIYTEIKSKINAININIDNLKHKVNTIKEIQVCPLCTTKIDSKSKQDIINNINSDISYLNESKKGFVTKLESINFMINKAKYNVNKLENLLNDFIIKKNDKDLIIKNIENQNIYKDNISNLNNRLKDINKLENEYRNIHHAFNKKSKYIIEIYNNKIINFINLFKKLYKNMINSNDILSFSIYDNKLSIILNNVPYHLLSTSQKKKIELAYLLSVLFIMMNNIKHNNRLNFIILDEYFDNFDSTNTNIIMNNLVRFKLNIQVLLTTNFMIGDDIILDENNSNINNIYL